MGEYDENDIAMFRINSMEKKLEFLGFQPIYDCEEWETLHVETKSVGSFLNCRDVPIGLYNELNFEVMDLDDWEYALLTGIGRIEVDVDIDDDNFDYDNYKKNIIYTKHVFELSKKERSLLLECET